MFMLIIVVITAGLSAFITYHAPKIKRAYNARKSRKNQKLQALISAEVERQIKQIVND